MAFDLPIGTATIWMEARGEPDIGKLAVAYVLLNRAHKRSQTITQVCLQGWQFSCWNTTDPNRMALAAMSDSDPVLGACEDALTLAMDGSRPDPTSGATLYYADTMASPPSWASAPGVTQTAHIGHHLFFKEG